MILFIGILCMCIITKVTIYNQQVLMSKQGGSKWLWYCLEPYCTSANIQYCSISMYRNVRQGPILLHANHPHYNYTHITYKTTPGLKLRPIMKLHSYYSEQMNRKMKNLEIRNHTRLLNLHAEKPCKTQTSRSEYIRAIHWNYFE